MKHYLYISGPITGHEDTAKDRFNECEQWILKNTHYMPINPFHQNDLRLAFYDKIKEPTQNDYMRVSFFHMTQYQNTSIVMLPDYIKSSGCVQELLLANMLCYDVFTFSREIPTIFGLPEEMMK